MREDIMPPETKDSAFLEAFYEMKSDIRSIKQELEGCSRKAGRCDDHHEYIITAKAIAANTHTTIIKASAITGMVVGAVTLILKAFHII